jgi:hypothetical protein
MKPSHHALLLTASLVTLAACTRQESLREIDWAKSALARNPQFEIVATDDSAGVFTVRDTTTGAIRTLNLKDLIAAPKPASAATQPANPPSEPATAESPEEEDSGDAMAADQTTESPELPGIGAETPASGALAEGPGYTISRGTGDQPEAKPEATLEGPGYRIEREEPARNAASATAVPAMANAEKRTDPIICQGNRQMHIDGDIIEFTGDAVIAEKGCDLYITNARIRAGGVGVIARHQARVHIVNSTIGGSRASYEASDGGEIYVARSTFEGVGRRFDGGLMTDLGGNSYSSR